MADVILQFKKTRKRSSAVTGHVDVKATSKDIEGSGKSPNITSFARIRTAYVKDPDFIFIILSIKHRVYSTKDEENKMMMGVRVRFKLRRSNLLPIISEYGYRRNL